MKKFTPEQNIHLHNDLGLKKSIDINFNSNHRNVDINKLLNRIKINKQTELKKKITFFCSSISILIFSAMLISIIK